MVLVSSGHDGGLQLKEYGRPLSYRYRRSPLQMIDVLFDSEAVDAIHRWKKTGSNTLV